MIYFIQQGFRGPIKIGVAGDVHKRLASLQSASPQSLFLVGMKEGSYEEELKLHCKFNKNRIRGEWFNATQELCDFANKLNLLCFTVRAWAEKGKGVNTKDVAKLSEDHGILINRYYELKNRYKKLGVFFRKVCKRKNSVVVNLHKGEVVKSHKKEIPRDDVIESLQEQVMTFNDSLVEAQVEIKTLKRKLRNWAPPLNDRVERRLRAIQ